MERTPYSRNPAPPKCHELASVEQPPVNEAPPAPVEAETEFHVWATF